MSGLEVVLAIVMLVGLVGVVVPASGGGGGGGLAPPRPRARGCR